MSEYCYDYWASVACFPVGGAVELLDFSMLQFVRIRVNPAVPSKHDRKFLLSQENKSPKTFIA